MSTTSSNAVPGRRRWQEILLNRRMLICLFQGINRFTPRFFGLLTRHFCLFAPFNFLPKLPIGKCQLVGTSFQILVSL